ncbi:IS256 family transposase, partial [Candidatus Nanopelagicales bacterium]|nr:IS256 family transposase [Candidatus Nanopelagicales bacterium]
MTLSQSALSDLLDALRSGEGVDLIRESIRIVMQELIEVEAAEQIGAGRYERTDARVTERNGSRPRLLATQGGDVQLRIPKLRKGSFFPSILEPRRRIDQALYAVVMEAYVKGVSTRSVDDLVEAMGVESGISKSEVSRICAGLDEIVQAFRGRRLDHVRFPYVYLDATYLHVRNTSAQVVSMAVVVATGITETGEREVLGLDIGDSEGEVFWTDFLNSLKARGLADVKLVISDQHSGLVAALRRTMQGVAHQRCRVHFARNLLAHVPKNQADYVAAAFRTVFTPPACRNQSCAVVTGTPATSAALKIGNPTRICCQNSRRTPLGAGVGGRVGDHFDAGHFMVIVDLNGTRRYLQCGGYIEKT